MLHNDGFPQTGKYDPQWIVEKSMGPNVLWLTEWLCREMRLEPGEQMGIVVPSLMQDFDGPVPEHLTRRLSTGGKFWGSDCWCFHTADWWRRHWERTGLVEVEVADAMPCGGAVWLQWERATVAAGTNVFPSEIETHEEDAGRFLGFVRMVARRKENDDEGE